MSELTIEGRQSLIKEQDELHKWGRAILQIYYLWYTAFLTVSGVALTWSFKKDGGEVAVLPVRFGIVTFFLFSVLGVIAAGFLIAYTRLVDHRIEEIGSWLRPGDYLAESAYPAKLAVICYKLTAFALSALALIWGTMFFLVH